MKMIKGKILWNVYAWTITIILLLGYAATWNEFPALTLLNFLLNISALIVLYLNIWNKEVGTQTSRKVYAFTFITWKLVYYIVLCPLLMNEPLNQEWFLGLLIWLPLFMAVFIFAFRNWEDTKNQSNLIRESKTIVVTSSISRILIVVSLILVIANVITSLSGIFILKYMLYSKNNEPSIYIIPVERKIAGIENQTQDNVKVNYANFEMRLPCKKIEKRHDDSISVFKITGIVIDKREGKGIFIEIPANILPKNKNGKEISFEAYSKMLDMTPDKVNFFKIIFVGADKKEIEKYKDELLLLNDKSVSTVVRHLDGIYKFETSNVKGFQFYNIKKNKLVHVLIFDKNDNQYKLTFSGFSQNEIDDTLASIRFK